MKLTDFLFYKNQKLEAYLGIRISKPYKASKSYFINKLFINQKLEACLGIRITPTSKGSLRYEIERFSFHNKGNLGEKSKI